MPNVPHSKHKLSRQRNGLRTQTFVHNLRMLSASDKVTRLSHVSLTSVSWMFECCQLSLRCKKTIGKLVKIYVNLSVNPSSAALAEGSRADCIQTISPRVQVSTRVRTCISYWRALSGGRCRGSSATPFQFIFIIDCQPHTTPYRRCPSFPGRRCTCLEQSARFCHFRTFRSSLPIPA